MRLRPTYGSAAGLALAGLVLGWINVRAAGRPPDPGPVRCGALAGLPLYFERCPGKDGSSAFLAQGRNYRFLLKPDAAEFLLVRSLAGSARPENSRAAAAFHTDSEVRAVRMQLAGANPLAVTSGAKPDSARIHYLTGADQSQWRTGIPVYRQVRVESVYPGIDLVYYGNQDRLEYDFHVHTGADPGRILLRFEGADDVSINEYGELVLRLGQEKVIQHAPVMYQETGGKRVAVKGGYRLVGKFEVGFTVGQHCADLPLIIDPVLAYSSYFGGNSGDIGLSIKVDAVGAIYIAGETLSRQFTFPIPTNAFQKTFKGGAVNGDGFVAKFDATGSNLIYFTYLGGNSDDGILDLAIDPQGNAYLAGFTASTNFPTKNALYRKIHGTPDPNNGAYRTDGFVAKLNPDGSDLVFSTYLGGENYDLAAGIAKDPSGYVYVTGYTRSTNFPVKNPYPPGKKLAGNYDCFVTKFGPVGTNLVYSTYLGGNKIDEGQAIVADAAGFAYVVGYTASYNFPLTNALQTLNGITNSTAFNDAFIAKLTPDGTMLYASPFGGAGHDYGYRAALDSRTNLLITGMAQSYDFPVTVTNIPALQLGSNAIPSSFGFLASFRTLSIVVPSTNASGTVLVTNFMPRLNFSAVFAGSFGDSAGWDLAVDSFDDVFVTGITTAPDFASLNTSGFLRATNAGRKDAFVIAFLPNAADLLYSGMLGGASDDEGYGIAVNPGGEAWILGRTLSTNFPTVNAFQTNRQGSSDCFVALISPEPRLIESLNNSVLELRWWAGQGAAYLLEQAPDLRGPWISVPGQPPQPSGWTTAQVPASSAGAFFRLRRL